MQTSKYVEEVKSILASIDEPDKDGQEHSSPETDQPIREIDVYIEDDRITFIPKTPPQEQVIDSVPAAETDATQSPQAPDTQAIHKEDQQKRDDKRSERIGYAILSFSILMLLSIIMLEIYFLMNPPVATITLVVKSQTLTLTGTLQLGRVIAPITLTQSQTAPTTGKGHQDAANAVGYITFYNGQFQSITIPAGTVFTGNDGVEIATNEDAIIPAASPNPPVFGNVTISAHAVYTGSKGNISAYDVNQTCCATSVIVKNTTSFYGGQDDRDFKVVTKNDIASVSTLLKTTLSASVTAALQAQLNPNEQLKPLPCTPTVTADHRAGQEAAEVKVTASETCSGIAYNAQQLASKATTLLTAQAIQTLGTGYSLIGEAHTTVTQATIRKQLVVLSFSSSGTWVYALTTQDQEHLKKIIAGKTKQEATALLTTLPGIKSASIAWEGKSKLPSDIHNIHLVIFVM